MSTSASHRMLLAALLLPLAACERKAPPPAAGSAVTVTYYGADYAFTGPDTVTAGLVTVRMKGPPPALPVGGIVGLTKGRHALFTVTLAAGKYVLVCFVPDEKDGKPHLAHGMVKEFTIS